MTGMKQILLIVGLVGCGGKAVEIDYGNNGPKAKSAIEKEINYRTNILLLRAERLSKGKN